METYIPEDLKPTSPGKFKIHNVIYAATNIDKAKLTHDEEILVLFKN